MGAAAPKGTWTQNTKGGGQVVAVDMQQLQHWAQRSAADLSLAEALLGQPLDLDQSLADVLPMLAATDLHGQPMLSWYGTHTHTYELWTCARIGQPLSPSETGSRGLLVACLHGQNFPLIA